MTNPISKNIKNARLNKNMTQEELATKIFTTRQTISNYETGKSKPDYETIGQIASALGVSAESLLYNDSDKRKKINLWGGLFLSAFIFLFGYSLKNSNILFAYGNSSGLLLSEHAFRTVFVPLICISVGYILLKLYETYIEKDKLYISRAKTVSVVVFIFLALWFTAALIDLPIIYKAAADPIKNEFGGPSALSGYIDSFYYTFIYSPLFRLPILNSFFAFLGGLLAVCFNKKED